MLFISEKYGQHSVASLVTSNIQALGLTVVSGKTGIRIACVYRSPCAALEESEKLLEFLEDQIRINGKLLVLGDLNAPDIRWHDEKAPRRAFGDFLLRCSHDYTLVQHVEAPTIWNEGQTPSFLDLILTRNVNDVQKLAIEVPLGNSDHGVKKFESGVSVVTPPAKYRRVFSRMNHPDLIQKGQKIAWQTEGGFRTYKVGGYKR